MIDFIAGGVGGICTILVGHPFDRVKTSMQLSGPNARASVTHTLRGLWSSGGIHGLYRGATPLLLGVAPVFALCFWGYGITGNSLRTARNAAVSSPLTLDEVGIAGAVSAFPATCISAPGERIKVLVMSNQFNGPLAALRGTLRGGGFASLYRGGTATLARDSIGSAAWFGSYEACVRLLEGRRVWDGGKDNEEKNAQTSSTTPSAATSILSGAAAGAANWLIALPLDVIKSRIQADKAGTLSGGAAAEQLWKEGGVKAFYRGLTPALLRALPANAACFFGVEQARKALHAWV